jgi:hypothetical protein
MLEGFPAVRVQRLRAQPGTGRSCITEPNTPGCFVPAGVNSCPMAVYVDGRRMNSLFEPAYGAYAWQLDEIIVPAHVAGIEIYASPLRAPPEYQTLNGLCGVVLVWTKSPGRRWRG